MARYIKANPLVAKYLQLENDRNTLSDGNYLFWQNDMLEFGPLPQLNDTLAMIGGIALMPHEAREEQNGTVCRPLPMATDKRFQQLIEEQPNDNNFSGGDDEPNAEQPEENNQGGESQTNDESQADATDTDTDAAKSEEENGQNDKSNE